MRKFLFVVMAVVVTGCAVLRPTTPAPQVVKETVIVPQVVKETVVVEKEVPVEKEVTRIVQVPAAQAQVEPAPAGVQAFGPTSGGAQVVMGEVQTLDDIRALGIPVLTDWPETAEAFHARATRGQPVWRRGDPWLPIELGEIRVPVGETLGWAVPREKGRYEQIVPFWVCNRTPWMQDGWMNFEADRTAVGRTGNEYEGAAPGSGVPRDFCGWVQGYTERPYDVDAMHRLEDSLGQTSTQPTSGSTAQSFGPTTSMVVQPTATLVAQAAPTAQATAPTQAATPVPTAVPVTEWGLERVRELFKLDASVVLAPCDDEPNCWEASMGGEIFQITNPGSCWQDGFREVAGELRPNFSNPRIGIPAASTDGPWVGNVDGATLRPCP